MVSGGKLIGVRNEPSLAGKKSARSKPKDGDEKDEERLVAYATTTKVQSREKELQNKKRPKNNLKGVETLYL